MRTRGRSRRYAWLVAVVGLLVLALLGQSMASAARITMTSKLKPFSSGQNRCTSQTVAVITNNVPATRLVVNNIDAANCVGKTISVSVYNPKLSSTWSAAQLASASATITTTTTTSITMNVGSFTAMVAQRVYVTIGGWQLPGTWTPGTPTTTRTVSMRENQHGKCLTVNAGNNGSSNAALADGQPVVIATCANGTVPTRQRWAQMSDGTLRAGGFCLAVPNNTASDVNYLQIKNCAALAGMQWTMDSASSDPGTFQWVSGLWWTPDPTNNGCLDNEGEAATDGTPQILYHCIDYHGNQEWALTLISGAAIP